MHYHVAWTGAFAPYTMDNSRGRGVGIAILDELDRLLKAGAEGEIRIRFPPNMLGYWNLPAETAAALSGTIKEIIVAGGESVYPAEPENALYGHPQC